MNSLALALSSLYKKEKNQIIFQGGLNLNGLALRMWTDLGLRYIDASVLSRIIHGKRLPTPSQLDSLCTVLKLPSQQREYLFYCLSQDYWRRDHVTVSGGFIPTDELLMAMDRLVRTTVPLLYQGACQSLIRQVDTITALYDSIRPTHLSAQQQQRLVSLCGTALYAKGRAIGSMATADNAAEIALPIAFTLRSLGEKHHLQRLTALSHVLLADAYYVAGGYSSQAGQATHFRRAIKHAVYSLPLLQNSDSEKLFAIRTIISASIYLHDTDNLQFFDRISTRLLPQQPEENYVNGLHLVSTVTKARSFIHHTNPFALQDAAVAHFQQTLKGTGIYELSVLKSNLETLQLLGAADHAYVSQQIRKGLSLAKKDSYERHRRYFENLRQSL